MVTRIRCDVCGAECDVPGREDARTIRCRCGASLPLPAPTDEATETNAPSSGKAALLLAEIDRWQRDGLIPARLADRLRAEYEPRQRSTPERAAAPGEDRSSFRIPLTPSTVLLLLGGIFILCAVLMLAGQMWEGLNNGGRFLLILSPTAALYAFGASLYVRRPERRVTANVLLFFACLLIPFMLWQGGILLFGEPNRSGQAHPDHPILLRMFPVAGLTLALHLLTLYRFPSPVLTIPYPFSFLWCAMTGAGLIQGGGEGSERAVFGAALLAGMILLGTGYFVVRRGRPAFAIMPDLAGSFAVLMALRALGGEGHHLFWETLSILASLGAIGVSGFRKNSIYLAMGSIFLIISIFQIGFEYFAETAGLPITLLICGALSMSAGFGIQRVRREFFQEE